jgi:hypothetical protein
MNASPHKPKLTARLIAAELESIADSVRRMSLKDRDAATDSQVKIVARIERLAGALK